MRIIFILSLNFVRIEYMGFDSSREIRILLPLPQQFSVIWLPLNMEYAFKSEIHWVF